ncbi:MAG: tRNA-dihydrouridine synthase family protein [Muribaculaceae bacterium]|jgi:tRNA-dihydrouridine synthase
MNIHFAPVQGHTDAPYRHFHAFCYEGINTYYTPFIRLERNELRNRDRKDFTSSLNGNCNLRPQIIFRNAEELNSLTTILKGDGVSAIDLNMGCPFPLQTGHGRGAATLSNHQLVDAVGNVISSSPEIDFSVKIRLGFNSPDEWQYLLKTLNNLRISHIAVHPRIARQQYSGDLYLDQFKAILQESKNPVIFNGDIKSLEDADRIKNLFPDIAGIMIGRGIIGRPSLAEELRQGREWDRAQRIEKMLEFHRLLLSHYEETLCGDSQLISKIKPFWEYAEDEIKRKAWKAIKKASNIAKYHSAVAMID